MSERAGGRSAGKSAPRCSSKKARQARAACQDANGFDRCPEVLSRVLRHVLADSLAALYALYAQRTVVEPPSHGHVQHTEKVSEPARQRQAGGRGRDDRERRSAARAKLLVRFDHLTRHGVDF